MINKDVTHPRMRRYIKNPRIVLLDSSLEYKKGESQVRALALFRKVDVRLRFYTKELRSAWYMPTVWPLYVVSDSYNNP